MSAVRLYGSECDAELAVSVRPYPTSRFTAAPAGVRRCDDPAFDQQHLAPRQLASVVGRTVAVQRRLERFTIGEQVDVG